MYSKTIASFCGIIFKTVHEMIQIPGQVIDWITIEDTLKRREWHTPEVAQAIAKLRGDVVPEADQVMAYVGGPGQQPSPDKMMKLSRVMSDYCMHKGQYKKIRISWTSAAAQSRLLSSCRNKRLKSASVL